MSQRYNTRNQRPSNRMKDVNDNSLAFDDFINSDEDVAIDRFGEPFPTVRNAVAARTDELLGLNISAEQSADRAEAARNAAESIADNEFTFHITPSDPDGTIAGLTGTVTGQTFRVGQGPGGGFKYYFNNSGVAIEISESAGAASIREDMDRVDVVSELISAKETVEYVGTIGDENLNIAIGFKPDGVSEILKLEAGEGLTTKSDLFDYAQTWEDPSGNITLGLKSSGDVEARRLITGDINITEQEIVGWSLVYCDPNGNIVSGIKSDGTIYPDVGTGGAGSVTFGVNDGDNIAILGDSYTDSLFTLKDKAYISNLSSLSDYRFRNFGISGNTATAINKRLVDAAPYFDGSTFSQMNVKYAFIMTYQNDSAYFINHAMKYYMYNMERLIDSVKAYGATPIVVSEWVATTAATAQLKALCTSRGIMFIDNSNYMKEVGNLVLSNFNQGHPGTRTNGVIWASLYEFIRRMPRPDRSIKIYRERSTFTPATDADMLFSGDVDRSQKWKELTVTHRSLPDADQPYFEELRGRGNVTTWQLRADEYDKISSTGVVFSNRMLINITYPTGSTGLAEVGFNVGCEANVEVFVRNILDVPSSIGQSGDVTPGAIDMNTLTADYLAKYNLPRGAWKKIGTGPGEYTFSESLEHVMFGDQVQVMLKATSGTLTGISGIYQLSHETNDKPWLPAHRPQSQLLGETFENLSSWTLTDVNSRVPLDQVNTPRNLSYSGALSTVASLMNGSSLQKTVTIAIPSTRIFSQPCTLEVELWARYFPKAFLDNSIYNLDPTQVVDSSQPGNTYPSASPINSDTNDFRNVTLRSSIGGAMTLQNTITQTDFACLFWRPLKYTIEIPAYVSTTQLVLNITAESDYIQLAKIYIKEIK